MHDIVGVATRMKHQVLYARVESIHNIKSNVKIDDEIRVIYEFFIKIT